MGVGPDHAVGSSERHFDPTKSETLKAIQAGEDDHFGRTFSEKIAEAEAPHIPPTEVVTSFHFSKNLIDLCVLYRLQRSAR